MKWFCGRFISESLSESMFLIFADVLMGSGGRWVDERIRKWPLIRVPDARSPLRPISSECKQPPSHSSLNEKFLPKFQSNMQILRWGANGGCQTGQPQQMDCHMDATVHWKGMTSSTFSFQSTDGIRTQRWSTLIWLLNHTSNRMALHGNRIYHCTHERKAPLFQFKCHLLLSFCVSSMTEGNSCSCNITAKPEINNGITKTEED